MIFINSGQLLEVSYTVLPDFSLKEKEIKLKFYKNRQKIINKFVSQFLVLTSGV